MAASLAAAAVHSSTAVMRALRDLSAMLGVALDDVMARHGVESSQLDDVDGLLPAQLEMDAFDELATRCHAPALGLRLATMAAAVTFDLADYVARNSPDL